MIYSFVFLTTRVFLYPILDFYEYFKHDFSGVTGMVFPQGAVTLGMCKVPVILRNRGSFSNLLAKLEQKPFLPNPKRGCEKEQKMIDECIWITNLQRYTYWTTAGVTLVGTVISMYTKRLGSSDCHDWQFPYGPFPILNVTYSPNYEISFFYQSISMAVLGYNFYTIDLLLAGILAHTCYQFKILKNRIRSVVELGYEEMMKDDSARNLNLNIDISVSAIPWQYLKNSLKKTVEYHLAILDLTSEVEEIFSGSLLIVFMGTLDLICFSPQLREQIISHNC